MRFNCEQDLSTAGFTGLYGFAGYLVPRLHSSLTSAFKAGFIGYDGFTGFVVSVQTIYVPV